MMNAKTFDWVFFILNAVMALVQLNLYYETGEGAGWFLFNFVAAGYLWSCIRERAREEKEQQNQEVSKRKDQ